MLHVFYASDDWDSCLAAWAVHHAFGDAAIISPLGPLVWHDDMLILNCPGEYHYNGDDPPSVLYLGDRKKGEVSFQGVRAAHHTKYQPACKTAWEHFHASSPPTFITEMDRLYGQPLSTDGAFNALLGVPWTIPELDKFINAYEDPQKRINLLADGQAIMAYRKLRGDLKERLA